MPGLAVSQIGFWVQNVAISWTVYDITRSASAMGSVMFFNFLPALLVSPFSGVMVDKFNRQKLLLAVQILYAVQTLLLTVFSFAGVLEIWNIILLGMMLSCIGAFDAPLRQSTFILVVDDKKDLINAISLNSTCFNLARLIGPSIGGAIIVASSVSFCFLINFLCLLPIIVLVQKMNLKDEKSKKAKENFFKQLEEGFAYCFKTRQIRLIILYLAFFCFLTMSLPLLLPIYVREGLGANADMFGFMLASLGMGALIASLFIASKTSTNNLRKIMFGGMTLACLSLMGLGFTESSKVLSLCLIFWVGFGSSFFFNSENVLLQSFIDDRKRGRVMSIHSLAWIGTAPFGNLFAGTVASRMGVENTFVVIGASMIIIGAILSWRLSKLKF